MAETNTSNTGFEKQIWDAACVLRGNLDASEYKSVVLGLIFLKYISDRFEAKYNELVAEGDGFEEDIDEYTSENIFFVPENARWRVISAAAHTSEIGTVIDDAMRSIEKENKKLKDILPKNFARPELDWLAAHPGAEDFCLLWTRLESGLKAEGAGFAGERNFSLLHPGAPWHWESLRYGGHLITCAADSPVEARYTALSAGVLLDPL